MTWKPLSRPIIEMIFKIRCHCWILSNALTSHWLKVFHLWHINVVSYIRRIPNISTILSPGMNFTWSLCSMFFFSSLFFLFSFFLPFFLWIYWGDIGSQNHTGFKCTARQNITRTLHRALTTPSKVSFCCPFPPFSNIHLPPPPFPSGNHQSVICVYAFCFVFA